MTSEADRSPLRVVQCWDDGIVDDIRLCTLLRKYEAKASFNLNFGMHELDRAHSWTFKSSHGEKAVWRLGRRELAEVYRGFSIANHTLRHPWLTKLPGEMAKKEIFEGRKRLQDFFQEPILGFAYPFGDYHAGIAEMVREAGHCYGRTTSSVTPSFPPSNPYAIAPDCHFLAADFWERFQRAKESSAAFYFWGHSYEIFGEGAWASFEDTLRRISLDEGTIWADLWELFA